MEEDAWETEERKVGIPIDHQSKPEPNFITGSQSLHLNGFSSFAKGLESGEFLYVSSESFTVGGHEWAIYFYPHGKHPEENSKYVSCFIVLISESIDAQASFQLAIVDMTSGGSDKHLYSDTVYTIKCKGSMWGYKRFYKRTALESSNYLKDDCLKIEATVRVLVPAIHLDEPASNLHKATIRV